jgi:hypothetical protein
MRGVQVIIVVIAMAVVFALAIPSAIRHDRNLPMSVTGKARK